jgi:hypothetical protein
VLQGNSVITYAIDGATGQLRPSATQDVGDAHTLAGEPQGRYVFAAFGPRGGPPYWDPSIVAYAPDPVSGSLTKVSEASSEPIWCPGCSPVGRSGGWYWLSASATRVYGMWGTTTYHDWYPAYVAHALDDDGQLGPAYVRDFGEFDYGHVTVDVESDVLYKEGATGLTAHIVEPDGSLRQAGASNLCVGTKVWGATPVAAVHGFILARTSIDQVGTTCSWEGPRLAPRANLGVYAEDAAALALREGASSFSLASRPAALVAVRSSYSVKHGDRYQTKYEVRLFAMGDDGHLEQLDTVEPGFEWKGLFHPSGRFLYVSQVVYPSAEPQKLIVYSIGPQGHLEVVVTVEDGGGAMAVTLPPQARATTGPATD